MSLTPLRVALSPGLDSFRNLEEISSLTGPQEMSKLDTWQRPIDILRGNLHFAATVRLI